ncbi:MAG: Hsp20 family protein [Pseudomonadota bacterium]
MNTFDISPFFRSTVGFDRLFDQLGQSWSNEGSWPQYDVLKTDEETYRITIAVPGYQLSDISIEARQSLLTIKGERHPDPNHNQYLYRGIGRDSFTRTFQLAEHVKVEHARLRDGLLSIELKREIPEALMPRRIEIETEQGQPSRTLSHEEQSKAA